MAFTSVLDALPDLPQGPGVYRFIDANGKDLYIGKAKNIAKRLADYHHPPARLESMMTRIESIQILTTQSEQESLILEASLISKNRPPYNILLKEKHPFFYISFTAHLFARPMVVRQQAPCSFGPFLSRTPCKTLLEALYKIFLLRSCKDSFFSARTRPCLQYDLGRCSAPCVGKISQKEYAQNVHHACDFLNGKTAPLREAMVKQMKSLSQNYDYDLAAKIRDRLYALDHLQSETSAYHGDFFVCLLDRATICLHLASFRHGTPFGHETAFFSESPLDREGLVMAFLSRMYQNGDLPDRLIVNQDFGHAIDSALTQKIKVLRPKRGKVLAQWKTVEEQAFQALKTYVDQRTSRVEIWQRACALMGLSSLPQRIEIYDNSHFQGEASFSGMVVATPEGFLKKSYRLFSLTHTCDDYDMMRQVMTRRFDKPENLPDLIMLDGGYGQWQSVKNVLIEKGYGQVPVIALVKNPDRLLGLDGQDHTLDPHDPVLHLFQRLRDEAHRWAHKAQEQKKRRLMFGEMKNIRLSSKKGPLHNKRKK